MIQSSRGNVVQGSEISGSQGWGLFAQGDCTGTLVEGNQIEDNARGDVDLSQSRGIVYNP